MFVRVCTSSDEMWSEYKETDQDVVRNIFMIFFVSIYLNNMIELAVSLKIEKHSAHAF